MNIAVYCGSSPLALPHLKEAARTLGAWIGRSGNALVYGGSSIGLMGEVSASALAAGAEVYGVEPQFFIDAGVAQHDLTRLHVVETMEERKALMIELADVFVALPGGVGTLEEISEIMSRIRLRDLVISWIWTDSTRGFLSFWIAWWTRVSSNARRRMPPTSWRLRWMSSSLIWKDAWRHRALTARIRWCLNRI